MLVGLDGAQFLGLKLMLETQRAPRDLQGLEVVPCDNRPRLVPQAEDADRLQGGDFDCSCAIAFI